MEKQDFLERIACELLQTLYQKMWFRGWESYIEGWAIEKIIEALEKAIEESKKKNGIKKEVENERISRTVDLGREI